jgi:hypothetical protein
MYTLLSLSGSFTGEFTGKIPGKAILSAPWRAIEGPVQLPECTDAAIEDQPSHPPARMIFGDRRRIAPVIFGQYRAFPSRMQEW